MQGEAEELARQDGQDEGRWLRRESVVITMWKAEEAPARAVFWPAVLIWLAAAGTTGGCGGGGGPTPDQSWGREVNVGEGIVLYTPVAEVDSLPEFFTWRTATAASYSMAIFDTSDTRIATFTGLPAPSFRVDLELATLIRPGVRYGWQVLALDGSGTVIDGSPVERFWIGTATSAARE